MGEWWKETPWRMIQTNLRETDLRDLDPEAFAQGLQELNATVVMVSTSGIVANYPTRLPFQTRNHYAASDAMVKLIQQCHQRGIRVIGRMDFSKVRQPISSAHPEWRFVGENGQTVCYNGDTHVCCNSDYQRRLSLDILRETLEMLPLDGVFFNFGGYTSGYDYSGNTYGDCVCENCKARFREMFGQELPDHPSASPLYGEFQRRTLDQAHREVRQTVAAIRSDICIANDYLSGEGFYRAEAGSSIQGGDWMYATSDLAKRACTGYPHMRASITSVDFIDIAYRYAAPSTERQMTRMYQAMAYGGAVDLYLMGRVDNREDRQGIHAAQQAFAWARKHEKTYEGIVSQASILLVRPDAHWMGGGDGDRDYRGWFEALTQAHYLFDAVEASRIAKISLEKYRVMIVPSYGLDEERSKVLHRFASCGGTVILGWGSDCVPNWAGIERKVQQVKDSRGGYIAIDNADSFPAFQQYRASVLPIIGGYEVYQVSKDTVCHDRIIEPHYYGPPERCYYTHISGHPGWTETIVESGKAIWLAWKPGLAFAEGHQNATACWMTELLRRKGGVAPVSTDAPSCVEVVVSCNRQRETLVQLLNLSGNVGGVWGGPLPISVQLEWSCRRPARVCTLNGSSLPWRWEDGNLKLSVDLKEILTVVQIV